MKNKKQILNKLEKLEKEFIECKNAKEGDKHFSKKSWDLRGHNIKGRIASLKWVLNMFNEG